MELVVSFTEVERASALDATSEMEVDISRIQASISSVVFEKSCMFFVIFSTVFCISSTSRYDVPIAFAVSAEPLEIFCEMRDKFTEASLRLAQGAATLL